MITINQLCSSYTRKRKYKKNKTPILKGNPQKKGICLKVFTRTPKKPNSALRKVSKLKFTNTKKEIDSYIPGIGHTLRTYSHVLIRGGRVPDLPGIKYKNIRGKYDFQAVKNRKTARSIYGGKKIKEKKYG